MRDSYEKQEISAMQWVPGQQNLDDALKKRNLATYKKLNDVRKGGFLPLDILEKEKRV